MSNYIKKVNKLLLTMIIDFLESYKDNTTTDTDFILFTPKEIEYIIDYYPNVISNGHESNILAVDLIDVVEYTYGTSHWRSLFNVTSGIAEDPSNVYNCIKIYIVLYNTGSLSIYFGNYNELKLSIYEENKKFNFNSNMDEMMYLDEEFAEDLIFLKNLFPFFKELYKNVESD